MFFNLPWTPLFVGHVWCSAGEDGGGFMQDMRPDYSIGPLNIDTTVVRASNVTVFNNRAGGCCAVTWGRPRLLLRCSQHFHRCPASRLALRCCWLRQVIEELDFSR